MKCTEIVIQDHIVIRQGLDIVDAMLRKLEDGLRIEIFDAITMVKFLRLFGDQYHQTMEENVLFPALLRARPNDAALVQLTSEHGHERTLAGDIEDALISRRVTVFYHSCRELTALLRNHCEREETVVANLAEDCLSKEQDAEIAAEFMKKRLEFERFVTFSRLERRYEAKPTAELSRPNPALVRAHGA